MKAGGDRGWSPDGAVRWDVPAGPAATHPFPDDVAAAAAESDVPRELVYLAWELVGWAETTPPARRALLLLALGALAVTLRGGTRVPVAGPRSAAALGSLGAHPDDVRRAEELLAAVARGAPEARALRSVLGLPEDGRPLVLDGGHLYAERYHRLEVRVAAAFRERLEKGAVGSGAAVERLRGPGAVTAGPALEPRLSEEQTAAVETALARPVTLVTGGPGTGKTSIVVSLLRAIARLEPDATPRDVALAAPTGKAADRLTRAVAAGLGEPAGSDPALASWTASPPGATTLHRLLSYSPRGERFRHHEGNPLPHRWVVVDEASMVGLSLMDHLLRSLPPEGRLVLLGDADQLPAVEAGAVFRDLVAAAPRDAVRRLTRSYRMDAADADGKAILEVAGAVREGREPVLTPRSSADELRFRGAEGLPTPTAEDRERFLERWWAAGFAASPGWREGVDRTWSWDPERGLPEPGDETLTGLFGLYERRKLLTAHRGWAGGTGAAALGAWLHGKLLGELGETAAGDDLAPGDPVLVTRNDYERELYNGDQGLVLRGSTGDDRLLLAVFRRGNGFRAFPLAAVRNELEPAWATTVHKAQGSEHDAVALVLPSRPSRLLTRELVYTALTRARHGVVVVGDPAVLAAAVAAPTLRETGLAERIARAERTRVDSGETRSGGGGDEAVEPAPTAAPPLRRQLPLF